MKFITDENELNSQASLKSLYFYANWMPFHKKFLTMIGKIESKYNIDFLAIDTDYFSQQCKRFNITSIPTIIILKDGKEIKRIEGLVLTSAFKSVFVDIFNNILGD